MHVRKGAALSGEMGMRTTAAAAAAAAAAGAPSLVPHLALRCRPGPSPPAFLIAEPLLGHVTGGGGAAIVAHRHAWRHPASPSSTAGCSAAVAALPRLEPGVQVEGSTCTVAVSCDSEDWASRCASRRTLDSSCAPS